MSTLKAEEISSVIKSKLAQFDTQTTINDVGTVMEVSDGIARIYGLRNAMAGELVQFEDGHNTVGMVLNLEEDNVGVVIFGDYLGIQEGQTVKTTTKVASVPAGDNLIGRVVNPVGEPLDGKGPIEGSEDRYIDKKAPGIVQRKSVHEPL
ncbi:MAG: F0F1 ATP synthase subunit alpha, partial [Vampirovibrionales bacterium]